MFRPDNKPPSTSDDELHIVFQGGQMLSDMRSRTGCLIAREQVLRKRVDRAAAPVSGLLV